MKVLAISVVVLCALAACSTQPPGRSTTSPCAKEPAGYECQIERYQNAPG